MSASSQPAQTIGGRYAYYVLGVLVVVYIFNFIDRQILAILAEDIKRDLGITDAEIGFLYGTAFAIFYSLFGIPLGRLADMWTRTRLMALGLALWSGMTALSGFAANFTQLALARVGVGIGEASASPCAYSLLSDYFPKEKRATVLSIYASGLYLGGGISLLIGGLVVDNWNKAFPNPDLAPLGLAGWQAAFLAVGLPGLLLAFLVASLREPVRGLADGLTPPQEPRVWPKFATELSSVLPPLTVFHLWSLGGPRAALINLAVASGIALAVWGLIHLFGYNLADIRQWCAMGIGVYAVASWAHSIKLRDKPTFTLIWGTPAFLYAVVGFGFISFAGYSLAVWTAPFVLRSFAASHDLSLAETGFVLGSTGALASFCGVIAGGWLGDKLKAKGANGRLLVVTCSTLATIPFLIGMVETSSLTLVYLFNFVLSIFGAMWVGIGAATTQDLVLPRMRGAAGATFFLGTTMIGLALGPYFTGKLSTVIGAAKLAEAGPLEPAAKAAIEGAALGDGLLALLVSVPIVLLCLYRVSRLLPAAEASRVERARAAGEPA